MVFWYFGTAFLRESHRAGGEDLRSTDMILHPVALQGKAVSAGTCTRPFTYAKRPSRQRLPFKPAYNPDHYRGRAPDHAEAHHRAQSDAAGIRAGAGRGPVGRVRAMARAHVADQA